MKSEIVSVGTELLLGQLVDTNAPYLAQSLSTLGIDVYWISQVGDNLDRLTQAFRTGWERSDLMVISGGLGPTGDDLTREAISKLLGEEMVVQPALEAELRAFFARRGRTMPERNIKQATLIPSATVLPNPIGTAPGWWVERDGHVIVAMPGVPVEMKRMWELEVMPRLSALAGTGIIFSRTIKVLGIGESWVEDELRELTESSNPTVATYAKQDGIHVRITAKAPSREKAAEMVEAVERKARAILGENIYGTDQETLADVVGALLSDQDTTLSVMELGSAGQLGALIGSASRGADRLKGTLVTHEQRLLARFGVDHALATNHQIDREKLVQAMATAART
ncbi:MAG: CinA family nicotinamide mononucleotide deamidase-related protein, partial [Chloroflexota bacterium]